MQACSPMLKTSLSAFSMIKICWFACIVWSLQPRTLHPQESCQFFSVALYTSFKIALYLQSDTVLVVIHDTLIHDCALHHVFNPLRQIFHSDDLSLAHLHDCFCTSDGLPSKNTLIWQYKLQHRHAKTKYEVAFTYTGEK